MDEDGSRGWTCSKTSKKFANDDKKALGASTSFLNTVEIHKPGANLYVGDISDKDIAKLLAFLPP